MCTAHVTGQSYRTYPGAGAQSRTAEHRHFFVAFFSKSLISRSSYLIHLSFSISVCDSSLVSFGMVFYKQSEIRVSHTCVCAAVCARAHIRAWCKYTSEERPGDVRTFIISQECPGSIGILNQRLIVNIEKNSHIMRGKMCAPRYSRIFLQFLPMF